MTPPRWLRVARDYPRGLRFVAAAGRPARVEADGRDTYGLMLSWASRTAQHRRRFRFTPPGGAL